MEDVPKHMRIEVEIAKNDQGAKRLGVQELGVPSSFACPECHGVLLKLEEGGRVRFRCHVGHAYSINSLVAALGDAMDDALWTALRVFEEGSTLMQQVAEHARERHEDAETERLNEQQREDKRIAEALRELIAGRRNR